LSGFPVHAEQDGFAWPFAGQQDMPLAEGTTPYAADLGVFRALAQLHYIYILV
jgi:hypothetical protein